MQLSVNQHLNLLNSNLFSFPHFHKLRSTNKARPLGARVTELYCSTWSRTPILHTTGIKPLLHSYIHVRLASHFLYCLDTTSCDCIGLGSLDNRYGYIFLDSVGYMYVSVTVNGDTESQRFNFYLQILKFQNIHRYVVGMFCTKYTCGRYQLSTYCT